MTRSQLISIFNLVEHVLRIGILLFLYRALVSTADGVEIDSNSIKGLHQLAVLVGMALFFTWKSKRLCADLVDMVRKPVLFDRP